MEGTPLACPWSVCPSPPVQCPQSSSVQLQEMEAGICQGAFGNSFANVDFVSFLFFAFSLSYDSLL